MAGAEQRQRFEGLVRDHARMMAAAIRRVCGRRYQSLVPDVEQEVYLALWRRLQGGNEIRFPTSYLYKMALTTALAAVRRLGAEVPSREDEEQIAARQEAPGGAGELSAAERSVLLGQLLERLGPDEARALRAYLAGFSHGEVAELYGWTESVARHRIYRTMERLRKQAREPEEMPDERRSRG